MSLLSGIQKNEQRAVAVAMSTLFAVMFGHSALETARDALFLAALPATRLPWVYLAIAVGALVMSRLGGGGSDSRRNLAATLFMAAVGTVGFWFPLRHGGQVWALYGLYVWSGVIITLVTLRFWILLGDVFTVTQAKRLFGLIGVGSVVGAIAGSAVAAGVSTAAEPRYLLLIAGGVFLSAGALPIWLLREREPEVGEEIGERRPSFMADLALLADEKHAHRIAILVAISAVALTLVDYLFKSTVAAVVPADELGTWFASIYTVLNILSLIAQLTLVNALVRRVGVTWSLSLLPVLLIGGAAGLLLGGGVIAAIALKGADGTLKHSVHRTATELLYLPLSRETRTRLKEIVDVAGQRGGQALASVFILSSAAMGIQTGVLAAIVVVLAALWISVAVAIGRGWLGLFRRTLNDATTHLRLQYPELDLDSFESLLSALNSTDDGEVLAGLDLITHQGRSRAIPALILYHPSPTVVVHALDIFAESDREDVGPIASRLLEHDDDRVRVAAFLARTRIHLVDAEVETGLESDCLAVRTAAAVVAVSIGALSAEEGIRLIDDFGSDPSKRAGRALSFAKAFSAHPCETLIPLLELALAEEEVEVQLASAKAAASVDSTAAALALLPLLAKRRTRGPARTSLRAMGRSGYAVLVDALIDSDLPFEIRLHIPRSISRFETDAAMELLVCRLTSEPDERIRYKILRGLGRMLGDNPTLKPNRQILEDTALHILSSGVAHLAASESLREHVDDVPGAAGDVHDMLVTMLADITHRHLEQVFRVLGILARSEDFRQIWLGLGNSRREVRASSVELLEHALPESLRGPLLVMVDEQSASERLASVRTYLPGIINPQSYSEAILAVMHLPSDALKALAVYQAGELGLRELRKDVASTSKRVESLFGGLIARARGELEEPILAGAQP